MADKEEIRKTAKNWREYLEDVKESAGIVKWVWKELVGEDGKIWFKRMMIALAVVMVLSTAQPWLMGLIINGLASKNFTQVFAVGLGSIFACMLAEKLSEYYQMAAREWMLGLRLGQVEKRVTELFFEKSLGQHLEENTYLNAANIEKGRNRALELGNMMLFEGIPAMLELVMTYAFLWVISPMAGLAYSVLLLSYIFWSLALNQKVVEVCDPLDREFRRLNRHIVERWDKIERVKTCGKENEELQHITTWFHNIIVKDRRFWLWFIKMITIRGLTNIVAHVAVVAYSAYMVWNGYLGIGTLIPILMWSNQISANLWKIGHIEHQINWAMPAVRGMMKTLSMPTDIVNKKNAVQLARQNPLSIEFASVSHSYSSGSPVLKNVSFRIKPGEKVAVIGSSGAGKTTIMRLFMRYMDPKEGSILVNGINLRDLALESWIRLLAYVPQQAQVLDGTIRYNLLYGLPKNLQEKIGDEELWEIMRKLQIDFGERLVDGLETVVGRNGVKLSGGQAQRLMVGSAVLRRPRFIIIDEATSSLDSTTEKAVQNGLAEILSREVGALIITHRLSTVRHLCDKFIVLKNSEKLQNGESQVEAVAKSFEELYEISSTFRRLADDQEIKIEN